MSWYDYAAIVLALLLALNADSDARGALRAGVAAYLFAKPGWARSYDLRTVFGLAVYRALRDLHEDGVIERKETPDETGERGGRDNAWYRWKDPPS